MFYGNFYIGFLQLQRVRNIIHHKTTISKSFDSDQIDQSVWSNRYWFENATKNLKDCVSIHNYSKSLSIYLCNRFSARFTRNLFLKQTNLRDEICRNINKCWFIINKCFLKCYHSHRKTFINFSQGLSFLII